MCGITGYIHFDREKLAEQSLLKRMTDTIIHRGPDGEGFYIKNNVALGHRRLSIIDLKTGDQPMSNDDNSIIVTFNGEIYNYIELRESLKKLGYIFRTESDTEVIIYSYQEWGVDCQQKFNGCWAFALWDEHKQQLLLSRDRIGEKPLHYAFYDNTFVFGSEIKCLFSYGIPKIPNLELIELYLVLTNIPAPFTFFKYINKLKPGHFLLVENNKISECKYWELPEIDENNMISDKSVINEKFMELLTDSVRIRMRSDVPYGAFLSGGLDSSSIVSLMSDITPKAVETFTIGFKEKPFDERRLAREVASKFKTNHHEHIIIPLNIELALKEVVFHNDEPFGDSSAIPTYIVSKHARKYVKMVLTGDGGDEILSGYNSFLGIKISSLYNKIPALLKKNLPLGIHNLAKPFKGNLKYALNHLEDVLSTANLDFNRRMIQKMVYTDYSLIKKLTIPIKDVIKAEDYFSEFMSKCTYKDDFYRLMYVNFKHDLHDDYLVKVDRMSMANSLEARIPFLDHRLIELMCRVDKKVKMQGWERKSILRNTIGRSLPPALLKAPKKGFGIPLREWFKEDNFDDILNKLQSKNLLLDKITLNKIITDNKNGIRDNGNFIWSVLILNEIMTNL
jgi:asparagine synthase (glutamine-hydrolysing)